MDYITFPTHLRNHIGYQSLPGDLFKFFIMLLTMAADEEQGGLLPGLVEIAADLNMTPDEAELAVNKLAGRGFLTITNEGCKPTNWARLFCSRAAALPKKAAAPSTPKQFVKPTPAEVSAYALGQDFYLDGQKFIDYYEAKGWMIGNSAMKDWKAAVRNWKHLRSEKTAANPAPKETKDW